MSEKMPGKPVPSVVADAQPLRLRDRMHWVNPCIASVALIVAAGVFFLGSFQIGNLVSVELASQQVFFPPSGNAVYRDPVVGKVLRPVAGEQVTSAALAKLYGQEYLGYLMEHVANGKPYAAVAAEVSQNPGNARYELEANTLFRYLTLQSLLLEAYAFASVALMFEIGSVLLFITGVIVAAFTVRSYLQG